MSDEFDDFLESIIKTRIKRTNNEDVDNYRKNGGILNQFSVVSPSPSSYHEAAQSLNTNERLPRLLFSLQKNNNLYKYR
jgi:hypothetical protein